MAQSAMAQTDSSHIPQAGRIIEYNLIKCFSDTAMKALFKSLHIPSFILGAKDGLNVYEVLYYTTHADGKLVKASGILYVPQGVKKTSPLMIYNHGTTVCRDIYFDGTDEQAICLAFATDGYIVLCPDYIGMGEGEGRQLYLNAQTEAGASVDMLIAVTDLLPSISGKPGKELFVTGYSQGGHAAMATYKLLQDKYKDRFPVTAASPMSGPYDIESTVYDARMVPNGNPGYLMLLMSSFYESRDSMQQMRELLVSPYDTIVPPMMNGYWPIEVINSCLPDTCFKAVTPAFFHDFDQNKDDPFRKYLAANNVYDWKPESPMELCYCKHDDMVTYKNSIKAYETMKKNGSKNVELWGVGRKFRHINCALFAVVYTKMFFDGFLEGHPRSHGPLMKRMVVQIGKLLVKP
jgi:pimeloyl-ACP methyl ester carboxylesterase